MKADDPLWGQSKTNVVEFGIEVLFCRDAEVTTMIGGRAGGLHLCMRRGYDRG